MDLQTLNKLEQLGKLLENKAITQDEFAVLKYKLLSNDYSQTQYIVKSENNLKGEHTYADEEDSLFNIIIMVFLGIVLGLIIVLGLLYCLEGPDAIERILPIENIIQKIKSF